MSHPSRRSFMLVAGAGSAAAAGVTAAVATGATASAAPAPPDPDEGTDDGGRVVAYVRDVATGEITLMRGDSETVVTDVALARSLSRLAR